MLAQICERFNWQCHAWSQMTNHYHLVVDIIWNDLSHLAILGRETSIENVFKNHVDKSEEELAKIKRLERMPMVKDISSYFPRSKTRNVGIVNAFKSGNFTLKEIGDNYGVHYSTVSWVVNGVKE